MFYFSGNKIQISLYNNLIKNFNITNVIERKNYKNSNVGNVTKIHCTKEVLI